MKTKIFSALFTAALLFSPCFAQSPTEGWTRTEISKGLVYYSFQGFDDITAANQIVNVIDLDLNCRKYQVKFCRNEENIPTSVAMKEKGAVAIINGGYESESIVLEIDGVMYSNMPNDFVMNTGVPNWKSEGAVYTDGKRDVQVEFSCKDIHDLDAQRSFYANDKRKYTISSAPMLIDDFKLVGINFADTDADINTLAYEAPERHQGVRHPRTAVAKTADNHFLMIVVDGRRKGISEGMSAKELTLFLARHFSPRYALNLDGGGSTTMCVKGQGDPETHVVNYPTDNGRYDHSGERLIRNHIYIVER